MECVHIIWYLLFFIGISSSPAKPLIDVSNKLFVHPVVVLIFV